MNKFSLRAACLAMAAVVFSGHPSALLAQSVTLVDGFFVSGLSADGTAATGNSSDGFYTACRWTAAGGLVNLGRSSGEVLGRGGGVPEISADGTRIAASIISADSTVVTAGRWTEGSGWEQMMPPLMPGGGNIDESLGTAWGISGDGNAVVGFAWTETGRSYATTWYSAGTYTVLESQAPNHSGRANGTNYDGSVVVGWTASPDSSAWQPSVWEDGNLTVLNYTGGWCEAEAVNPAGDIIVGASYIPASHIITAAMWVKSGGSWNELNLGYLPGTFGYGSGYVTGTDLTPDGSIVVGYNRFSTWSQTGIVWTLEQGLMRADDYLAERGVSFPDSLTIDMISAISDDGNVLAGISHVTTAFPQVSQSFIVTLNTTSAVPSVPAASVVELGRAHPNPFNPSTSLTLNLAADSGVEFGIYDARGSLVRVLHQGYLAAGDHVMTWDGRLQDGRSAPSGLYLARVRTDDGSTRTSRMMLIK